MDERAEAGPDPTDVEVGQRIKLRRNELGLSQERLGKSLGITFQQVQKYERGTNRVSASRLAQIAEELKVPVGYFFGRDPDGPAVGGLSERADTGFDVPMDDILRRRESLDLVRAYWRIPTRAARKSVFDLVRSLGAQAAHSPVPDDRASPEPPTYDPG